MHSTKVHLFVALLAAAAASMIIIAATVAATTSLFSIPTLAPRARLNHHFYAFSLPPILLGRHANFASTHSPETMLGTKKGKRTRWRHPPRTSQALLRQQTFHLNVVALLINNTTLMTLAAPSRRKLMRLSSRSCC